MEERKKKKGSSARARLTKSFGFGKREESDSDSDDAPFAATVQSSWLKDEEVAEVQGYELVMADESPGPVPRKRSSSSRSRRTGEGSSTPKALKRSARKKRTKKAEASDGDSDADEQEEHGGAASPTSGEAGARSLKGAKKGGSKELRKRLKDKGKDGVMRLSVDVDPEDAASLGATKRRRSSSSLAKPMKGSKKKGSLSKSHGKSRSSPRKARKGSKGSPLQLSSSSEMDEVEKRSPSRKKRPKTRKEEAREEAVPRTLTSAALDDQPVEFTDERRRRRRHNPPNLRRSASLSKLMETDEMAAMRGAAHARGLFGRRDTVDTARGLSEAAEDDFDKPQPENTVLRSKSRSGWKSLLKKSQLSRIDLKKALGGKKSRSQPQLSRSKIKKKDKSELGGSAPIPSMAYRKEADISSMDSLKLLLAGDERMPSFRRFLDATYSSENLAFIEVVAKFRSLESEEERRQVAAEYQAMKTFIGSTAPQELNLDVREVRKLEDRWEDVEGNADTPIPQDIFDTAYDSVFSLLYYDLYMRYIVSKTFTDFEAGLEP